MDITETVSQKAYKTIKYFTLIIVAIGFFLITVTSVIVHDTAYITTRPRLFVSELLIMGLLTSLPVAYISWARGGSRSDTLQGFFLIFMKIILIHIGFQLSGVYTALFSKDI
jgi:hypothetical protein